MFQVIKSGDPKADDIVLSNMTALLDRIFLDVKVSLNIRICFAKPTVSLHTDSLIFEIFTSSRIFAHLILL